jgi:hypothetical protein
MLYVVAFEIIVQNKLLSHGIEVRGDSDKSYNSLFTCKSGHHTFKFLQELSCLFGKGLARPEAHNQNFSTLVANYVGTFTLKTGQVLNQTHDVDVSYYTIL